MVLNCEVLTSNVFSPFLTWVNTSEETTRAQAMQQFPAVPLSQKASLAMKFSLPTSENCPKVVQLALTQYPNTKYPPVLYIYLFLYKRTALKSILESISTVPGGEVRLNNESPSSSTPPPLNQRICVSSGTLSKLHTVH